MYYNSYTTTEGCVKAEGGKGEGRYAHYCPKEDFYLIVREVMGLSNSRLVISRPMINKKMDGRRLARGRKFDATTHYYKTHLTLFVLESEGLIRRTKASEEEEKRIVEYELAVTPEQVVQWMEDVKSDGL